MRILALDVGHKTIGVAISDETGSVAFPRETIARQQGWRRDMAAMRALVQENAIRLIVVGLPLMPDGSAGPQSEKIEEFIAVLRRSVRVPIARRDEGHTTVEAEGLLWEANRSKSNGTVSVDSAAACVILQSYLDECKQNTAGALPDARSRGVIMKTVEAGS